METGRSEPIAESHLPESATSVGAVIRSIAAVAKAGPNA